MALALGSSSSSPSSSSSCAVSGSSFPHLNKSNDLRATQIGAFKIHERTRALSAAGLCVSIRRHLVKAVNAEPNRNDSMVTSAAIIVAPEVSEKTELMAEDYVQLSKDMDGASPLAVMDKALEKFGNDIAIAFR